MAGGRGVLLRLLSGVRDVSLARAAISHLEAGRVDQCGVLVRLHLQDPASHLTVHECKAV